MRSRMLACTVLLLFASSLTAHEGRKAAKDGGRDEVHSRTNANFRVLDTTRTDPRGFLPAVELNALDQISFAKMRQDRVPINALADDGTFIRRLHLVLTGRLPDPARTRSFLADTSPSKRATLIDEVLASEAFNDHWSFFFHEFFEINGQSLRNGQRAYTGYFSDAVRQGIKLDTMAYDLMTAKGQTDQEPTPGYVARATNGARLLQDQYDNMAIFSAYKFWGVPLECISCHDGQHHLEDINLFLAEKTRADLWGQAAFFSDFRLRPGTRNENNTVVSVIVTDSPNPGYNAETTAGDRPPRYAGVIQPKNILTGEGVNPSRSTRENVAGQIIAHRQFARNWANLLWGELFGVAMVEPRDGFDLNRIDPNVDLPEGWELQVLDPNLLEHMADQIIAADFDLRDYLRYVCNSATFQMDSTFHPGGWRDPWLPYFTRYPAHRMDAETVYDSLVTATGTTIPLTQNYRGERGNAFAVDYAHQLIDNGMPVARRNFNREINGMLSLFGRGNRLDLPRTNEGSVSQALLLMSSPVVDAMISSGENRVYGYSQQGLSREEIVENIFLDVLCRKPSPEEVASYAERVASFANGRLEAESLLWLLLNRVEFTFVY